MTSSIWRYEDLRAHVLRSVELVSPEKAGRQVIYLNNPGRREHAAAVGWLDRLRKEYAAAGYPNARKSTRFSPVAVTIWLQVRVLSGQPSVLIFSAPRPEVFSPRQKQSCFVGFRLAPL
jgi:hypothetical protein